MRLASKASIVVAIVAFAALAAAADAPPPAGWVDEPAREGSVRTLRHVESQAGVDIARMQLSPDDVARFQRNLTTQLEGEGFEVEVPPSPTSVGGLTATMTRYTRTVLDIQFTVLVVDVFHKNSLVHVVAWLRPTDDVTEDALEDDVLSMVTALVK